MKRLIIVAILLVVWIVPGAATAQTDLNITYTQEIDNLNPMYSVSYLTRITQDMYLHGAWTFDDAMQPVPRLVTEIPTVDGNQLTLTLRNDLRWSDDEALTASDFVFTAEMVMAPENNPVTRVPYYGLSVAAPNDTTVVVTFDETPVNWLGDLFRFVLPEHILRPVFERDGSLDRAEWNFSPTVGNGPFVFAEWVTGEFTRFSRNENYWGEAAAIGSVTISYGFSIDDNIERLNDATTELVGPLFSPNSIRDFVRNTGATVETLPAGINEVLIFNLENEVLQDQRVRQAIALTVDPQSVIDEDLYGYTARPNSLWTGTPYADPNAAAWAIDPAAAEALLDEAGWEDSDGDGIRDKDGVRLEFNYLVPFNAAAEDAFFTFQRQLAEIGIGINLASSDGMSLGYLDNGPLARGNYDIAHWGQNTLLPEPTWEALTCDAIPSEDNPFGTNWTRLCDPEIDALIAEIRTTPDLTTRFTLAQQLDARLRADALWIGMWEAPDFWLRSGRLQGTALHSLAPFWNISDWRVG